MSSVGRGRGQTPYTARSTERLSWACGVSPTTRPGVDGLDGPRGRAEGKGGRAAGRTDAAGSVANTVRGDVSTEAAMRFAHTRHLESRKRQSTEALAAAATWIATAKSKLHSGSPADHVEAYIAAWEHCEGHEQEVKQFVAAAGLKPEMERILLMLTMSSAFNIMCNFNGETDDGETLEEALMLQIGRVDFYAHALGQAHLGMVQMQQANVQAWGAWYTEKAAQKKAKRAQHKASQRRRRPPKKRRQRDTSSSSSSRSKKRRQTAKHGSRRKRKTRRRSNSSSSSSRSSSSSHTKARHRHRRRSPRTTTGLPSATEGLPTPPPLPWTMPHAADGPPPRTSVGLAYTASGWLPVPVPAAPSRTPSPAPAPARPQPRPKKPLPRPPHRRSAAPRPAIATTLLQPPPTESSFQLALTFSSVSARYTE